MKQTEDTTPEQYRAELIERRQKLQVELVGNKSKMAKAFIDKDQQLMSELSAERTELATEIAEIDSDLRQLKHEIQPPSNNMGDLNLIVQLVAAEIAHSGSEDVNLAICRLKSIKEILSSKQA